MVVEPERAVVVEPERAVFQSRKAARMSLLVSPPLGETVGVHIAQAVRGLLRPTAATRETQPTTAMATRDPAMLPMSRSDSQTQKNGNRRTHGRSRVFSLCVVPPPHLVLVLRVAADELVALPEPAPDCTVRVEQLHKEGTVVGGGNEERSSVEATRKGSEVNKERQRGDTERQWSTQGTVVDEGNEKGWSMKATRR